jgi:hypothetical protein
MGKLVVGRLVASSWRHPDPGLPSRTGWHEYEAQAGDKVATFTAVEVDGQWREVELDLEESMSIARGLGLQGLTPSRVGSALFAKLPPRPPPFHRDRLFAHMTGFALDVLEARQDLEVLRGDRDAERKIKARVRRALRQHPLAYRYPRLVLEGKRRYWYGEALRILGRV